MMKRRELLQWAAVLTGGVVAESLTQAVLAGALGTDKPSRAIFFGDTREQIAVLAEMIIPQTDTPGALAAGVPNFIEVMVTDWYTDGERKIFFDGLAQLDVFCKTHYDKTFMRSSAQQRSAALQDAEQAAASYQGMPLALNPKVVDANTPFFTKIRELTVLGYYSSEVGATQELAYNPMPMRYDGDYDLSKSGRQWSR